MSEVRIIPTIVPESAADLAQKAQALGAFAPLIHVDAADGVFAPHTSWLPQEGDRLPGTASFEAHLMLARPLEAGVLFARAGAKRIIAHREAFADAGETARAFAAWKEAGAMQAGLAFKLDTPLENLDAFIAQCDCALFMTIRSIGAQGNAFEPAAIGRISEMRARYPHLLIEADGGINESNAADVARAGAARLCAGSAISRASDPRAAYERLDGLVRAILEA